MNLDEIKALIRTVTKTDVTELEYESGDEKIRIVRGTEPGGQEGQPPFVVMSSPLPSAPPPAGQVAAPQVPPAAVNAASTSPAAAPAEEDEDLVMVVSPIVGTFYEAPSPDAPAFIQIGDKVASGQVLCIIEAMKLMNEIEAEASGVVVKRFVSNAQPVEYGEALFALRPE